jgi:hypothetical protein
VRSTNQFTLEFSQAAKHSQHQAAMWRCRIGPRIDQRLEANATLAKRMQRVEQIPRRPCQAIEPRHDQHIARLKHTHHLGQLEPISLRTAGSLREHLGAAGGPELCDLDGDCLAVTTDPRHIRKSPSKPPDF